MVSIGQQPSWLSKYMPSAKDEMDRMLSTELKEVVSSSMYAFPKKPFDGQYKGPGGPGITTRANWLKCTLLSLGLLLGTEYVI